MDKSYLDRMIKNIAKNSNANYQAVKQGTYAQKGSDDWLIGQMKKKLSKRYCMNILMQNKTQKR